MKKFFLIPLMTLVCSVMAWAAEVEVATYDQLRSAVAAANKDDVIKITDDMEIRTETSNTCVMITKSITIDGQGHSITGYAVRASKTAHGCLIAINGSSMVDVVINDLTLNDEKQRALEIRGNLKSLTIDNCVIRATGSGYQQAITFGGNQSSVAEVNISNSTVEALAYYPIIAFNPIDLTITDSRFDGWCSVYFKGIDGSEGSHGSTMTATNTYFNAQNFNSGHTNAFGAFPLEDDGINIVLDNCVVDVTAHDNSGIAWQTVFLLSSWSNRANESCSLTVKGANSHIIGDFIESEWDSQVALSMSLEGGSYYGSDFEDAMLSPLVSIATGYHAEQVNQGGQDIYRIVKDAAEKTPGVKYDLNDDVPTDVAGEGNNPSTSFELSTGGTMELDEEREVTTAGYVQVKDNEDSGNATIVKVGTTETADPTQKVDQTLIVNNGLDVQGNSQVTVQPGSTLQIGEGGIVTEKPSNIVIEANENGAASMIMDPAITVNTTPNLTVRMTAKQIGRNAQGDFYWHRFAMPVAATITSWDKEGTLVAANPEYTVQYPTYIYGWNYDENKWKNLSGVSAMVPLQGYTITLASDYIHVDGDGKVVSEGTQGGNLNELQDVVYTFKGNLVGNTDQALNFQAEGFNFFGNSYTGYMDVLKLIEGIQSNNVEGTVYMWCNDPDDEDGNYQSYVGVPLYKLSNPTQRARLATWQQEVAPMQTFILRLRGADSADESISYASAIWGNPRYGNNSGSGSGAPRRRVASINEDTYMEIAVKAANGKGSRVDFTESANNSDDFESGYDVVKYMNENSINLYATINGEDFSSVVTNNIVGKTLSLKTNNEIAYTMSFKNVEGEEYAIRDNATGAIIAIEEGATYEFAAQPNSTIEGRFEIISVAKMPTAIENTEVKANAKGIYTIMGQYLGEDFEALPAGVYVVNGVKIVK